MVKRAADLKKDSKKNGKSSGGLVFLAGCIVVGLVVGIMLSKDQKPAEPIQQRAAWKRIASEGEDCDALFCVSVDDAQRNAYGGATIVGRGGNFTGRNLNYVQVVFGLYTDSGVKLGTCMDNVAGLANGETWAYSAYCSSMPDGAKYKVDSVDYY